jgi:biopolymer transport protein ExbD
MKMRQKKMELDMTPMVDVTFLLLIFFMVTASFVMQKSMNRPIQTADQGDSQIDQPDQSLTTVEIEIDEFDSYFVTLPESEPREAHSAQDLRIALRDAKSGTATKYALQNLLIRAHADSTHGRVITAMDVGTDLDFSMQVQIMEEL